MKANYEFMALKRIQMYYFTLLIKKQFLSLYSTLSVSWDSVLLAQKPKLNTAYPSLDAKKIFSGEHKRSMCECIFVKLIGEISKSLEKLLK